MIREQVPSSYRVWGGKGGQVGWVVVCGSIWGFGVLFFSFCFVLLYRCLGKYFFGKFFAFGSSVLLLPHVSAVDA